MKVTFGRVLRSEWTKTFSLRANWIVLAAVPVALIALAGLIGLNNRDRPPAPTAAVGGGFLLYALAIGVFGVLAMTAEHNSGLSRSTLLTVPARLPVLWAKALVLIVATGPVMLLAYAGSYLAHEIVAANEIHPDRDIILAITGATGATVAAGLIGLAIGTMLRSTPGAIFTFVIGLVVLPQAAIGGLPESAQDTAVPFIPTLAMQAMFQVGRDAAAVSPAKGAVAVAAWVLLMLCGAAALLRSNK